MVMYSKLTTKKWQQGYIKQPNLACEVCITRKKPYRSHGFVHNHCSHGLRGYIFHFVSTYRNLLIDMGRKPHQVTSKIDTPINLSLNELGGHESSAVSTHPIWFSMFLIYSPYSWRCHSLLHAWGNKKRKIAKQERVSPTSGCFRMMSRRTTGCRECRAVCLRYWHIQPKWKSGDDLSEIEAPMRWTVPMNKEAIPTEFPKCISSFHGSFSLQFIGNAVENRQSTIWEATTATQTTLGLMFSQTQRVDMIIMADGFRWGRRSAESLYSEPILATHPARRTDLFGDAEILHRNVEGTREPFPLRSDRFRVIGLRGDQVTAHKCKRFRGN